MRSRHIDVDDVFPERSEAACRLARQVAVLRDRSIYGETKAAS